MSSDEIRAFFEEIYKTIHKYDEGDFSSDEYIYLSNFFKDRFKIIAKNWSEDGKIKKDFAGRLFFVYQNSNIICKYFIINLQNYIVDNSRSINEFEFFKIDFKNQEIELKNEFKNVENNLIELFGENYKATLF